MVSEGLFWSWMGLLLLGAFHGINPSMGWLFAVALGMQERRSAAVWQALIPLGMGHLLAVGGIVLVAGLAGRVVSLHLLKTLTALMLIGLGLYRLVRQRHPGWGGMRVGLADLTIWSFLMASAHGAGLMVLPIFMGMMVNPRGAGEHALHYQPMREMLTVLLATLVHGAGYLLVTALIAWLVFAKLGLALLQKAWVNLDLLWAAALIVTGGFALAM